jgi:DNA-binding transcriptional LysR family regulator
MLNLNYELLKLFQAVMTEPTLKETAEKLNVTPSAVSQSLKKLEDELGVQLFMREHKKLILTSQGQLIKEKLSPLLNNLEETLSDFMNLNLGNEPSGTFTVGAPFELGSTFLVKACAEFQKKYPKVKAQFKFATPMKLLELVSTGEIDFALSANGVHFKNLGQAYSLKNLFDEELVVIAPKSWKVKADYQELIKLPHLDYASDGSAIGMWYQLHFKKTPKKLNIPLVAENALSLTEGVKAGLGIAMIPLQRVQDYLDSTVTILKPTPKRFINPIVLIQHSGRIPTLAEKKFIESLNEAHSQ